MAFLVYKLTHTANGKAYVGMTARALDTRWLEHCQRALQGQRGSRLYDAMRKYGIESFTREIIATADTDDEARSLERAFIRDLGTYENGYNANLGGCGALHFTPEQRRKIGDAQRGKVIPAESRAKMSAAKKGDRAMAARLGDHTEKGRANPRSIEFTVRLPNGDVRRLKGLRAFCRANGLQLFKLKSRSQHKGFALLSRSSTNSVTTEKQE